MYHNNAIPEVAPGQLEEAFMVRCGVFISHTRLCSYKYQGFVNSY